MVLPYSYICIEGNIGAGKTTLANILSKDLNARLIKEEFDENPFLPLFYKDPGRYGLQVELSFLADRYNQIKSELLKSELFTPLTIADYFLVKSRLFAYQNLTKDEYSLFQSIYSIVIGAAPKPDLIIYIHDTIENLLKKIEKRGRSYEQQIKPGYLKQLEDSYTDWIRKELTIPILLIHSDEFDFLNSRTDINALTSQLQKKMAPGLNHFPIQNK